MEPSLLRVKDRRVSAILCEPSVLYSPRVTSKRVNGVRVVSSSE